MILLIYQNSVNLTRIILSKSMNMTIQIFLHELKNVAPLLYPVGKWRGKVKGKDRRKIRKYVYIDY